MTGNRKLQKIFQNNFSQITATLKDIGLTKKKYFWSDSVELLKKCFVYRNCVEDILG